MRRECYPSDVETGRFLPSPPPPQGHRFVENWYTFCHCANVRPYRWRAHLFFYPKKEKSWQYFFSYWRGKLVKMWAPSPFTYLYHGPFVPASLHPMASTPPPPQIQNVSIGTLSHQFSIQPGVYSQPKEKKVFPQISPISPRASSVVYYLAGGGWLQRSRTSVV